MLIYAYLTVLDIPVYGTNHRRLLLVLALVMPNVQISFQAHILSVKLLLHFAQQMEQIVSLSQAAQKQYYKQVVLLVPMELVGGYQLQVLYLLLVLSTLIVLPL